MKKISLLLPFLLLFSCSIQKRKYQNGFYVDWNHKKTSQDQTTSKKEEAKTHPAPPSTSSTAPTATLAEIHVSTGDKPTTTADIHTKTISTLKKRFSFMKSSEDSCDVIIYKDGSEIRSRVQEIGISEVKYKRCDTPDGPVYVSKKADIFMIKYSNGTKEVFKQETTPNVVTTQPQINSYKSNKYKRENHPLALPTLILGILSLIVGYILGLYAIILGTVAPFLVIPLLLGIVATGLGITASNRIREQPDVYKGKGMVIPGFIMGLIVACIYAMIFFFYFLFNV